MYVLVMTLLLEYIILLQFLYIYNTLQDTYYIISFHYALTCPSMVGVNKGNVI